MDLEASQKDEASEVKKNGKHKEQARKEVPRWSGQRDGVEQ